MNYRDCGILGGRRHSCIDIPNENKRKKYKAEDLYIDIPPYSLKEYKNKSNKQIKKKK